MEKNWVGFFLKFGILTSGIQYGKCPTKLFHDDNMTKYHMQQRYGYPTLVPIPDGLPRKKKRFRKQTK